MKTVEEIKEKAELIKSEIREIVVKADEAKTTEDAMKFQPMINSLSGQLYILEWVLDFERF